MARNRRPAVEGVRRPGGIHRRRLVLYAQPSARGAPARTLGLRTRWTSASAATASYCSARVQPRSLPNAAWCVNAANYDRGRFLPASRMEIEVARRFLGIDGKPARYLIITIPPRQLDKIAASGLKAKASSSRQRSDRGLDQRDDVLPRRLPTAPPTARIRTQARSNRSSSSRFCVLVEEGVDQCIAGDRLQRPVTRP